MASWWWGRPGPSPSSGSSSGARRRGFGALQAARTWLVTGAGRLNVAAIFGISETTAVRYANLARQFLEEDAFGNEL